MFGLARKSGLYQALVWGGLCCFAALADAQIAEPAVFSLADRDRALAFWSDPGRYGAGVPSDVQAHGLYQVRLTVAGSRWLDAYQKLSAGGLAGTVSDGVPVSPGSLVAVNRNDQPLTSRKGKRGSRQGVQSGLQVPPTVNPTGPNPVWDAWIAAKIANDRYQSQVLASSQNAALGLGGSKAPSKLPPAMPGPCPADLVAAAGDPPRFAEVTTLTEYSVHFDDADFVFQDHAPCSERYRSYRFERGIEYGGTPVTKFGPERLGHLARMAGLDSVAEHVFSAVSILEGGFDALNTYDTGFVSVGFIQFAALQEGGGSLGTMLLSFKASHPDEYDRDFRAFGIDVTASGKLAVLDLETGVELHGPEATARLIDDKRLIAVFGRAGQRSDAYIAAQFAAARAAFYPIDDQIAVTFDRAPTSIRVGDFMKSEAGLATLTDLKVNRGMLFGLAGVLQKVIDRHHVHSVSELSAWESEIMAGMKYRHDFSKDKTLTQPKGGHAGSDEGDQG